LLIIGGLLLALGLLVNMMSFTVRFTEAAVVTTFGKADHESVVLEPGLKFKFPPPVQSVTVYDTRARFLKAKLEQQQTRDDRQVIVESFVTWRVTDPLVFYQSFRRSSGSGAQEQYKQAEQILQSLLRSSMSEVSKYALTDLLSSDLQGSKLAQLEADVLGKMRGGAEDGGVSVSAYGVEVLLVGVNKLELPEKTTTEVFGRMQETRRRIAASAESEGMAIAEGIRSDAQNAAQRIRDFASVRAREIESEGDREAAQYLVQLNEEPDFAVFLQNIQLLRQGLGKRTNVILNTASPGLGLFSEAAARAVREGRIPAFTSVTDAGDSENK
jgi:membrane protease subunit HflC